jgi:hypothetical protein
VDEPALRRDLFDVGRLAETLLEPRADARPTEVEQRVRETAEQASERAAFDDSPLALSPT